MSSMEGLPGGEALLIGKNPFLSDQRATTPVFVPMEGEQKNLSDDWTWFMFLEKKLENIRNIIQIKKLNDFSIKKGVHGANSDGL